VECSVTFFDIQTTGLQ